MKVSHSNIANVIFSYVDYYIIWSILQSHLCSDIALQSFES